ncbi:MAG: hypothetical protein K5871_05830 [Lachnospiraceae bacterium]|nr:hypothetical protein [Lachnospiraceae bacterium]
MSLKIVRGDIKNMNTDGLLDASLMSGLGLKFDDEEVVRMCYREVLEQSGRRGYSSLSMSLITDGKDELSIEEGILIAAEEAGEYLKDHEMQIFLVVPEKEEQAGPLSGLEEYIEKKYVAEDSEANLCEAAADAFFDESVCDDSEDVFADTGFDESVYEDSLPDEIINTSAKTPFLGAQAFSEKASKPVRKQERKAFRVGNRKESKKIFDIRESLPAGGAFGTASVQMDEAPEFSEALQNGLNERVRHMEDSFSEYLLYLIESKGMSNAEVYKRALVDKKVFSKIKNNPDYHPQKLTALCLCVGAKLNMDETTDLLARAGYALSPCDKTDIIFSYFIENRIYDMIELDIQLEEHGLECIIA